MLFIARKCPLYGSSVVQFGRTYDHMNSYRPIIMVHLSLANQISFKSPSKQPSLPPVLGTTELQNAAFGDSCREIQDLLTFAKVPYLSKSKQ